MRPAGAPAPARTSAKPEAEDEAEGAGQTAAASRLRVQRVQAPGHWGAHPGHWVQAGPLGTTVPDPGDEGDEGASEAAVR